MALGSITIDLLLKTGSFVTDSKVAEKRLKDMGDTAERAGKAIGASLGTIGGVAAGAVAGILGFSSALDSLKTAIDGADRLDELNARFGITTEQLSSWGYAAKMTGSDLEGLASIIPKFSKNIAEAADSNSTAGKTFAALGINIRDQSGQLRSFQDLLPEVADKFKLLDNATTETALAMQLFGKSGSEFLEFLNLGSDGLKSMEDRAKALGIVIDSNTASAAANFNDRMDDLKAATNGWFTQLAAQLLPTLNEFATKLVDLAKNGDAVRAVADGVSSAFSGIGQAVDALQPVFNFFDRLRGVLVGVELQGNAAAQALNPANWNSKDLPRLQNQYKLGASYAANGYAAMQPRSPSQNSSPQVSAAPAIQQQTAAMAAAEAQAKALQDRLDALLNGSGSSKPSKRAKALKEVKDAATQAVEDYDAIYGGTQDRADSQVGALEKEIALWGDRTEAAKVSYEIQRGALQGISEQQAEYLLSLAKTRDALEDYDDIYGKIDEKAKESTSQMSAFADQAARNMQDAFADFLFDPFEGGVDGMLKSFSDAIRKMVAQVAASKLFDALGSYGQANSGSWWGSLLSSFSQKKATGGYISGPGTATSDSIPAYLSNGEYVVKADAVSKYGRGFFDAINARRYASGGYVSGQGSSVTAASSSPQINVSITGGSAGAADVSAQRNASGGFDIDVLLKQVDGYLARSEAQGGSSFGTAIRRKYNLRPAV
ncbi:hypothetical protein [Pseudoxanthomonas winnipegensis]|uniref:Phage tail tape measure protein n=1 Tax=Pseudoxanthomonas winnipegensis TaxID=2480810 RepID=A0A4Q8L4J3_9GAMM|nr:hypothetical protein [Pseudoxanthomonas winnipegensis]TAA20290.1 hypothetical protein EA660_18035 [Pseudoxanthomonas winnipegensis]